MEPDKEAVKADEGLDCEDAFDAALSNERLAYDELIAAYQDQIEELKQEVHSVKQDRLKAIYKGYDLQKEIKTLKATIAREKVASIELEADYQCDYCGLGTMKKEQDNIRKCDYCGELSKQDN
jgi:rubrerythrin|tara:strand:+ start:156 stop:524 length:369 start_codon:yes stop_codon:yes gene_type:complete